MRAMNSRRLKSSFRDPSGCVIRSGELIYRQVNQEYRDKYDHLMSSGLYDELTNTRRLIPHVEVDRPVIDSEKVYRILKPENIDFISYPYEWSFSQLKDAALLTLDIQRTAMNHGMSLKDASAYNIQFHRGKAVFIDTLSFETLDPHAPWVAYRQFCRHFLGPLALMAKKDFRLSQLFRSNIDGLPLDLVSNLLPARTWLNPFLFIHLYLHANSTEVLTGKASRRELRRKKMSPRALDGLIDSLRSAVTRLKWHPSKSAWSRYRDCMNYTPSSYCAKKKTVARYLDEIKPSSVWDLGSNDGEFSRIAAKMGIETVSFDSDYSLVESHYRRIRAEKEKHILPLVMDLCNPSPSAGWAGCERDSLLERGPADCILALAIVHHLAIGNNVPLEDIARFFKDVGRRLIVEFVPRNDSQIIEMLRFREDIFHDYNQVGFESAFSNHFRILGKETVGDSGRTLYLLERT